MSLAVEEIFYSKKKKFFLEIVSFYNSLFYKILRDLQLAIFNFWSMMCTHRNDLLTFVKTPYLLFYTSFRAATNIIKKMLPSVPSADPASGSRSRRFHRPTLISPPIFNLSPLSFSSPIPPSPFNHFQSSPSFQLRPKVNFRELPSGARITGLLSVNPLVSIPSFSRGYPYLSGQHPRLRSAPICGTECFR